MAKSAQILAGRPAGAVMASLFLSAIVVGGCAASSATGQSNLGVPANYRALAALKMRELEDVSVIKAAEITPPHERFVGLLFGGTRPVVCVRALRPNLIGSDGSYFYLIYFANGQADGYKQGAYNAASAAMMGCGEQPLTPFTELVPTR